MCSIVGSKKEDVLVLEESGDNVFVNIRNTKDFRFVTVNIFSELSSKVIDRPIHECSVVRLTCHSPVVSPMKVFLLVGVLDKCS